MWGEEVCHYLLPGAVLKEFNPLTAEGYRVGA